MRALVALAIYVSLGAGTAISDDNPNLWIQVHDQGVAALQRADFQTAAERFQQSWELAETPTNMGLRPTIWALRSID